MKSLGSGLLKLLLGFCRGLRDAEFRAIAFLLASAVVIGSIFFRLAEGWAWIDAAYFSVMALTTVGDANLAPATAVGKIFTMIFSLSGIGLMLAFLARLTILSRSGTRQIESAAQLRSCAARSSAN
jgi:Ion channel